MEDDSAAPPLRMMSFISEEQLDHAKKTRGERAEDGTAQRDKPLFEIIKENKDRKDAEFNERFKHRPPKALDEDETEFLDNLETSRREYERQLADEEAQQLRSFQEAVAVQSSIVHELKETPIIPKTEDDKPAVVKRRNPPPHPRPGNLIISVKPQAKRAKTDKSSGRPCNEKKEGNGFAERRAVGGLVCYSDESDSNDD